MAQTIRRSGKGVRRVAATRNARTKVATARKQTGNFVDQAMRWLPFSDETLHRLMIVAIIGTVAGVAAIGAEVAGVPAMAEQHLASFALQLVQAIEGPVHAGNDGVQCRFRNARVAAEALQLLAMPVEFLQQVALQVGA